MSNHASKGTALITGASTGIGAVYADRLAKRGYDLILVARSQDKLNDVARQVQSASGRKVEALQADLTFPADVKRVADRLATDTSITALVNNAQRTFTVGEERPFPGGFAKGVGKRSPEMPCTR